MNKIAVVILHIKERKQYLDQILAILEQDIVDVYIYDSVESVHALGREYARIFKELESQYEYISFVDDDDLVCYDFFRMLMDKMKDGVAAASAHQIQFKFNSEVEHLLNNKLVNYTDKYPYLSFHGPSLISIKHFKPYVDEYGSVLHKDSKRLAIKLLQRNGHKTLISSQVGCFWRLRDNEGKGDYYE